MKYITYWDLILWSLDQEFIDKLIEKYDIDCSNLEITYVFEKENFTTADLTNAIIHEILREIILQNVEDQEDIFDLEESIYTNCIDSWFDIDPERLRTEEAKDLVKNF